MVIMKVLNENMADGQPVKPVESAAESNTKESKDVATVDKEKTGTVKRSSYQK